LIFRIASPPTARTLPLKKVISARPVGQLDVRLHQSCDWRKRLCRLLCRCYEADEGRLSLPSLSFVHNWERRRLTNGPSNPLDSFREYSPLRDRVDVKTLLRTLIAWCPGERHVWSLVRIPSIDEEDLRRSHRERSRLVRERTAHINRIKGLKEPHPSRAIVRACSRVASRNGAAGYKVMRSSHEPMDIDAGPAERAQHEESWKSRAV
jgi:hypothetical protein